GLIAVFIVDRNSDAYCLIQITIGFIRYRRMKRCHPSYPFRRCASLIDRLKVADPEIACGRITLAAVRQAASEGSMNPADRARTEQFQFLHRPLDRST